MFSVLFSSILLQRVFPLFSDLVGLRLTLRYAQLYIVLFSLRHREGHRLVGALSEIVLICINNLSRLTNQTIYIRFSLYSALFCVLGFS